MGKRTLNPGKLPENGIHRNDKQGGTGLFILPGQEGRILVPVRKEKRLKKTKRILLKSAEILRKAAEQIEEDQVCKGKYLDNLAKRYGIKKRFLETDAELRKRTLRQLREGRQ